MEYENYVFYMNFRIILNKSYRSYWGKTIFFLLVSLLFFAITVSRRPDAITNPQFYAEDGVLWYSESYNSKNTWEIFLDPKQGYLQTVSRLGAQVGLFFDIKDAPLFFNVLAISIQILPALFFLSVRFDKIVPGKWKRFVLSFLYLVLPATFETHANLTNAQWRMALLSFLIIIAKIPDSKKWKVFDSFFLLVGALSGPFIFFLFPLALAWEHFSKIRRKTYFLYLLGAGFLIQLLSFFLVTSGYYATSDLRSAAPLGASFLGFFKLLSGKIFVSGIFGLGGYEYISQSIFWKNGALSVLIGILGLALMFYVFVKSFKELRLFIIFSFMIFLAGIISPQVSLDKLQWEVMLVSRAGNRYFLFSILAWTVSLVWLSQREKIKVSKIFAIILLGALVLFGIPGDYKFPKFENYKFNKQVNKFNKLSAGEKFDFKIVPGWTMTLIKK